MILRNNGDILVFAPALIITGQEVDRIIHTLDGALKEAADHYHL
jgi:adenosylmethionine-8-amino-7-oxononanoate aminotransferase